MKTSRPCPSCGSGLTSSRLEGLCPKCAWSGLAGLDAALDESEAAAPKTGLFGIPGYQVIGELARGGMGIVYRARQLEPQRDVALKMLLPHQLGSAAMRERFRLEARAIAALEHPAILPVFQFGEHDGMPYFTMKLATGGSLADQRQRYLGRWREIAELMARIAEAVHFAHERGVLHRDLKPANILFDETDRPFVSDFGLAKMVGSSEIPTRSGHILGTPQYLAPEIAQGSAANATIASDQYSLGSILYELLTGQPPFSQIDLVSLLRDIIEKPVPLPRNIDSNIPPDLEVICLKCLSKEPARRYPSTAALSEDLRNWLDGRAITARPVSGAERAVMWARRHKLVASLVGLIALLVTALAIGSTVAAINFEAKLQDTRRAEARTARLSRQLGQRTKGLADFANSSQPRMNAKFRDEFLAHLPLLDFKKATNPIPEIRPKDSPVFDPLLQRYAILHENYTAQVIDVDSGQKSPPWRSPTDRIKDLRFSPDGSVLMVELWSTGFRLIDPPTGRQLSSLPKGDFECFSSDGKYIFIRESSLRLAILVYDAATGREISRFEPGPTLGRFMTTDTDSTNPVLAISTSATIQFWNWRTKELLGSIKHSTPVSCLSLDNGFFVIGDESGLLSTWDLYTGKSRQLEGHRTEIKSLMTTDSGRLLISRSEDGECRVWDLFVGGLLGVTEDYSVIASTQRTNSVILSDPKGIYQADLVRGIGFTTLDVRRPGSQNVRNIDFNQDSTCLAVARFDGITLFDVASGLELGWLDHPGTTSVHFHDDNHLVLTDRHRMIYVTMEWSNGHYELREDDSMTFPKHGWLNGMSLSANRRWCTITTRQGVTGISAFQWPLNFGKLIPTSTATSIASIDSEGKWLSFNSKEPKGTFIHDIQSATAIPIRPDLIGESSFSPDGKTLLINGTTAHATVKTHTWTNSHLFAVLATNESVSVGAWSPDGQWLAISKERKPLEIWRASDMTRFIGLESRSPQKSTWMQYSRDGSHLAVGTHSGRVELWNLAALIRELKPHLRPEFTTAFPQPKVLATRHIQPVHHRQYLPDQDDSAPRTGHKSLRRRDPGSTSAQLNLGPYYNAFTEGPWPMRGELENTFRYLHRGLRTLNGIPFDIQGVILLNSRELEPWAPRFPHRVDGIPVNTACRTIHFLQSSGHAYEYMYSQFEEGLTVASVEIRYANGQVQTNAVRLSKETADWWFNPGSPNPPAKTTTVWTGLSAASEANSRAIRLFDYTWPNPHPDWPIASLNLVSARNTPTWMVLAITTE